MLAMKAAELFDKLAEHNPTMFTLEGFDEQKRAKFEQWRDESLPAVLSQFEGLLKDGHKFTGSGNTVGELGLFSTLFHIKVCWSRLLTHYLNGECVQVAAGLPLPAKLDAFYNRLAEHPKVKLCLEDKTQMGELGHYIVPAPTQ